MLQAFDNLVYCTARKKLLFEAHTHAEALKAIAEWNAQEARIVSLTNIAEMLERRVDMRNAAQEALRLGTDAHSGSGDKP